VAYLAAVVLTGYVVLSPAFDVPFGVTGWLLFAGPGIWAVVGRRKIVSEDLLADLLRPWPLALAFVGLLLVASHFALAWHLPTQCNGISLNCLKGYEWTDANGVFSHTPTDGVSSQISRATYIEEVGVHLRSAAAFGIFSLALAWAAAIAFRKVGRS
jgi:hypothetical protein